MMIARKTLIPLAVILVTATPAAVQAQDATILPRELKIGTYTTQGTMYRASRREIARQGNRVCIKTVDGIPTPSQPLLLSGTWNGECDRFS